MTQPQLKFADAYKKYVEKRKFLHISAGGKRYVIVFKRVDPSHFFSTHERSERRRRLTLISHKVIPGLHDHVKMTSYLLMVAFSGKCSTIF